MLDVSLYDVIQNTIVVMVVVLYCMITVCAVESRSHWFVRTAIVGISLSALLALPAYEVAIEFGIAVAVFAAALALSRPFHSDRIGDNDAPASPRNWLRISLRDVFLITVLLAVVMAVAVHVPMHNVYAWLFTLIDGAVIALMGLAGVWLVFGRARLGVRLAAAPFILAFNVIATQAWLWWFSYGLTTFSHNTLHETLQAHWQDRFRRYWLVAWPRTIGEWAIAVTIGTALFIFWLSIAKRAGWFSQSRGTQARQIPIINNSRRRPAIARPLAMFVTAAIAVLPLYVWIQLVTPHPLPPEAFASNRHYEELVNVADELYKVYGGDHSAWFSQVSDAQIRTLVARDEPQWQRLRTAVEQGCQFPWQLVDDTKRNTKRNQATWFLAYLMYMRAERGDGTSAIEPRVAAAMDLIRLGEMQSRASSMYSGEFTGLEGDSENQLWNLRTQMTAQQCREIAQYLWQIEQQRESPTEFAARSRWIIQNAAWEVRLGGIAFDWAYWWGAQDSWKRRQELMHCLLIVELGIRAYESDRGRLPKSLDELVPDFLVAVPSDPYGQGVFKYKLSQGRYLLYSVGPNGTDEGGAYEINGNHQFLADVPIDKMFQVSPPAPAPASTPPPATRDEAQDKSAAETKRE